MKSVRLGLAAASVAVIASLGAANAASITLSSGGNTSPFDNNAIGATSGTTLTENGSTTFLITGGGGVVQGSVANEYLAPLGDSSHYVLATPNGPNGAASTVEITYTHPVTSFTLLWGSPDESNPDTYNLITLGLGNGQTISGGQLLALTGTPSGDNSGTRWVTISSATPFSSWTASASGVAFEFDLKGVPEPSTWAMMGLGFAALGFAAFRRSKKIAPSIA